MSKDNKESTWSMERKNSGTPQESSAPSSPKREMERHIDPSGEIRDIERIVYPDVTYEKVTHPDGSTSHIMKER
ncbi:MAG: hypothetical protein F6K36_24315 [Symploca sp. SIO3C6]|nr:hypothetical protein [Symploca sp. SIO3C6]